MARLQNTLVAYSAYIGELLWPADLAIQYPYAPHPPLALILFCGLTLAAVTLGAICSRRSHPYLLVGWLWFLGTLVPVIGLVQVGSQAMADRYTYLPSVGIFIALCWGGADAWERLSRLRWMLAAGIASALALCAGLGQHQVGYWRDGVSLSRHSLAVTRPTANTLVVLGDAYFRLHQCAEAEAAYRRSFQLDPNDAKLMTKLGILQLESNHWEEARKWLQQVAARGDCNDPALFNNLGFALNRLGRGKEALPVLRRSLDLRPNYALAHTNLGDSLLMDGDAEAAAAEYERALVAKPDSTATLAQLAWLYSFADPQPTPQRAAHALDLARHAVDLTQGQDPLSLDALAAAEAAVNDWPRAAALAKTALSVANNQPGTSTDLIKLRTERVERYNARQWPER